MQQHELNSWDQVSAQKNRSRSFHPQLGRRAATGLMLRNVPWPRDSAAELSRAGPACDSLNGPLARTLSGSSKRWTTNKHRAALGKERSRWQDLSPALASGWLQVTGGSVVAAAAGQGQGYGSSH